MSSSRLLALAKNLALSASACLAVLLVMEAGLRLGAGGAADVPTLAVKGPRWLLDCYASNPRGYFPLDLRIPAVRQPYQDAYNADLAEVAATTPWAVLTRLNSDHFRDREPSPKPEGVTRIVVIGDSFSAGQGVREEDAYPRALERELASAPGRYEVRSCAIRGLDFPALQELLDKALEYQADVVVYGMVLNDVEQSAAFEEEYPSVNDWILDRTERPRDARRPWLRTLAFVSERASAFRIGRDSTRWYQDMYGPRNREGWWRTQERIRAMKIRTRDAGGRFLLALWPLLVGIEGGYPFLPVHRSVAAFSDSAGIPFHDLLPAMGGRLSEQLWVHESDHHPNERAHALAARSLAPVVRKLAERNQKDRLRLGG